MKYIDADKLIAEIERLKKENGKDGRPSNVAEMLYSHFLSLITSLQQEQPDYKEAVQLVFEEELTPFKDGNQWCFLLGRNLQDGICGFGDTILDAAVDFYKDYTNTKIHIGELKISMAQQEQPEVDLEKEIGHWMDKLDDKYCTLVKDYSIQDIKDTARHFWNKGYNAKKEE